MDLQITRATPADRGAVITTVVTAFAADPAFRYFFPDDASYATHAGAYAGYLFDKRVGLGSVLIAEGGAVAALWQPPGERADHTLGPDLPADARDRIDRFDAAVAPLLPREPYWYLGVIATRPSHAGRRLGRRLLAAGVSTAHAAGLPAVLETSNPSNVDLYRSEGWRVVGRATEAEIAPTTWVLINTPEETQ